MDRSVRSSVVSVSCESPSATDPVTEKYKTLSKTFHGSAKAADEALRNFIDQQAPERSDGIGATFDHLLHQGVRWRRVQNNIADRAKPPRIDQHHVVAPCRGTVGRRRPVGHRVR